MGVASKCLLDGKLLNVLPTPIKSPHYSNQDLIDYAYTEFGVEDTDFENVDWDNVESKANRYIITRRIMDCIECLMDIVVYQVDTFNWEKKNNTFIAEMSTVQLESKVFWLFNPNTIGLLQFKFKDVHRGGDGTVTHYSFKDDSEQITTVLFND